METDWNPSILKALSSFILKMSRSWTNTNSKLFLAQLKFLSSLAQGVGSMSDRVHEGVVDQLSREFMMLSPKATVATRYVDVSSTATKEFRTTSLINDLCSTDLLLP